MEGESKSSGDPMDVNSNSLELQKSSDGDRQIRIHPLVIINISDHYTRLVANQIHDRVLGVLYGVQNGLEVSISNSFELKYEMKEGKVVFDRQYLKSRTEQFATVYPNNELLGWYSIGQTVLAEDLEIHREMTEFNENPLYMLLNATIQTNDKNLPISLFESEVHVVHGTPTIIFVKTGFKVETLEAERIAVEHVAKVGDGASSSICNHLESVKDSVTALKNRIGIIHEFLVDVQNGEKPMDHHLVRKIASICNQLPLAESDEFNSDFFQEYNDSMLVTFLASITKGVNCTNDIIDKFSLAQGARNQRGGMI